MQVEKVKGKIVEKCQKKHSAQKVLKKPEIDWLGSLFTTWVPACLQV